MNEVIEKEEIKIENMIYEIRGVQVMLDSDLALLYECKNGTKEINQAVKNNPKKFPEKYSWILTNEEWINLRSKILTSSLHSNYGGRRYLPRVFAEPGIYMLSTVLKSDVATQASIKIMDTFVEMRKYINDNKNVYKSISNINNKLLEHDDKINYLFSKFDNKEQLLLTGHTYDSYSSILDILSTCKYELIIIDSYADKSFLDLIRNIKSNVILITKNSDRLSNIEIEKYNKQYNNLKVVRDNSFHDRYFIVDRKEIYLCGSSINSLGDKTSMIIKLEDDAIKNTLLKNTQEIINK